MPSSDWFAICPNGEVVELRDRLADAAIPFALRALAAQEGRPLPSRITNERVEQLAAAFGFEFEPWAEPGHLRMQPMAARMHAAARTHARFVMHNLADELDLPLEEVSGAIVVDARNDSLQSYLALIQSDPSLYGAEAYALSGTRAGLVLRQTSCVGKYSVAAEWDWETTTLPRCLYEISDSFRGEPEQAVEQLFRLRRFTLPEAHVHHRGLTSALEAGRDVNRALARYMRAVDQDFVLLISATHETWNKRSPTLAAMVADADTWALAVVSAEGDLCQDGIELDFEYKFVDATGTPRELATFQIDVDITCAIYSGPSRWELTTTHLVPTGSVERLVYAHLDRVAREEKAGRRATLPPWLSPVPVRILIDSSASLPGYSGFADVCGREFGAEIDDRTLTMEEKIADADRLLIPRVVWADPRSWPDRLCVRSYTDRSVGVIEKDTWLAEVRNADPPTTSELPRHEPRLSRRAGRLPFTQ